VNDSNPDPLPTLVTAARSRRQFLAGVGGTALTLALAACGSGSSSSSSKGTATAAVGANGLEKSSLNYQNFAIVLNLPELADDLGYLKPLTLNRRGTATTGPAMIQATAAGDLDFGGSFYAGIIAANQAGNGIRSVVDYIGNAGAAGGGLWVLDDSPIHTVADLRGKKIGVTVGTLFELTIDLLAKKAGLSTDDYQKVAMAGPAMEPALRKGQVDAIPLATLLQDTAVSHGGIRRIARDDAVLGTAGTCGLFFTDDFIAKNPKTVRHFTEASAKALAWAQAQPRKTVIDRYTAYLTKHGRGDDAKAFAAWTTSGVPGKGGVISEAGVEAQAQWLVDRGTIKDAKAAAAKAYTNEFNPYGSTPTPAATS
jgi:ABC-type nitrate/sulfonate/bicarbonate transport system substrate-binding protein